MSLPRLAGSLFIAGPRPPGGPLGWIVPDPDLAREGSARGGGGGDGREIIRWVHLVIALRRSCLVATGLNAETVAAPEAEFDVTTVLPPGAEPFLAISARDTPADFMYEPELGDGVQVRAAALAVYGNGPLYWSSAGAL